MGASALESSPRGSVSSPEQVPGSAGLCSEEMGGGVLFPRVLLLCADVLFGFTLPFHLQINQLTSLSF